MLIEIAINKNMKVSDIKKLIANLDKKSSPFYNQELYLKVKDKIDKVNKSYDPKYYKRLYNLEKEGYNLENYSKDIIIKKYYSLKKYYLLMLEFQQNEFSNFMTLTSKYHLTSNIINLIVNEKDSYHFKDVLENYVDAFSKYQIKKVYLERQENPYHPRISYCEKTDPKLISTQKNSSFWLLIMLHFRLNISSLATLLDIKDVKRLHYIISNKASENPKFYNAYMYLNTTVSSNENNIKAAKMFYKKYLLMRKIDLNQAKKMLDILKDQEFHDLLNSKKALKDMTKEELLIVTNYWLKYALANKNLPYSQASLNKYCRPINPKEVQKIEEFNQETLQMFKRKSLWGN